MGGVLIGRVEYVSEEESVRGKGELSVKSTGKQVRGKHEQNREKRMCE